MPRSAAPAAFLAAFAAVVGLGAADGGYFPSQWGLATLGFVLVGVTVLVVGAVVQAIVDPRRARLLATGLVVGAPALAGVLLASRYHALTTAGDSLTTAQREGRELAWILVVLALIAAAVAVGLHLAERPPEPSRPAPAGCSSPASRSRRCSLPSALSSPAAGRCRWSPMPGTPSASHRRLAPVTSTDGC